MQRHVFAIALTAALVALTAACAKTKGVCQTTSASTSTECSTSSTSGSTVAAGGGGAIISPVAEDPPPTSGTGPTFSDVLWSGYTVSWTAASDAETPASQLEYQLVAASDPADLATVAQAFAVSGDDVILSWAANTLTATVSGRPQNDTRAYAVLVRNQSGNLALYPAASATTPAEPAPTPGAGISVSTNASGCPYELTWGAASDAGDSSLTYAAVFAASASAINTVAAALNDPSSEVSFFPTLSTCLGAADSADAYAAVIVKNSNGGMALYPPVQVHQ